MHIAVLTILVLSVCFLAWGWVGFPLLLVAWPKRKSKGQGAESREVERADLATCACLSPRSALRAPCSIIIAAYNEEEVIRERLDNLASIDLPEGTEILVGCDGCDDQTAKIAGAWSAENCSHRDTQGTEEGAGDLGSRRSQVGCQRSEGNGLRVQNQRPSASISGSFSVFDFPERRGKPSVLKDLVAAATGDILILSDANTMFAKDAIRRLLAPFADPKIGGVCGRLVFVEGQSTTKENLYWRLETWLKIKESQIDSCLGANGAIYAIRHELFWSFLPSTTIVDDFVIGMKVREAGKRLVYVSEAVAREDMPKDVQAEWHRRIRIGAGGYQAISLCKACLAPRYGFFALAFWSHKVLRWFTPHLMILALATTGVGLWLAESTALGIPLWILLACQMMWYLLGVVGGWLSPVNHGSVLETPFSGVKGVGATGCRGVGGEDPPPSPKPCHDVSPAFERATEMEASISGCQHASPAETAGSNIQHSTFNIRHSTFSDSPAPPASVLCALRSALRAIYYFNIMQLALLIGFIKFLRGIRTGTWRRTER